MRPGELCTELVACLRQARKYRRTLGVQIAAAPFRTWSASRCALRKSKTTPYLATKSASYGGGNAINVGMLVERSTLPGTLAKIGHATAAASVSKFGTVLNRINKQRRLSMTHDRGREMAQHERLAEITRIKVYFADSHSP